MNVKDLMVLGDLIEAMYSNKLLDGCHKLQFLDAVETMMINTDSLDSDVVELLLSHRERVVIDMMLERDIYFCSK